MGYPKNNFKVKKPQSRHINEMIRLGSSVVDDYSTWKYMFYLKKHTRAIDVIPINGRDKFLITPKKKIIRRTGYAQQGKHDHYRILP